MSDDQVNKIINEELDSYIYDLNEYYAEYVVSMYTQEQIKSMKDIQESRIKTSFYRIETIY